MTGAGASGGRVLALDLGSSSVRALLYDDRAEPVPDAHARRAVQPQQGDDGRGELDPQAYVAGLVACLDELSDAGVLDGVALVATSSQWHSVLAVGADGAPQSAVLTWLDTRAQSLTPTLPADPQAFHERTGAWVHPLFWTTKVPWLRAQLGGDVRSRFLGLPDYVRGVLLDDDTTSVSVASGTGMLDLARQCWDPEALEIAGLSAPDAELPAIDDTPRRLARRWRDRWPALAGADWCGVVGDGAASNLGSGCADADAVGVTVGTSAALRVVHGPDAPPPPATVWRYRVDTERLVSGVAFSGGGVLHAWAVRMLGLDQDAEPNRPPGTVRPRLGPAPRRQPAARNGAARLGRRRRPVARHLRRGVPGRDARRASRWRRPARWRCWRGCSRHGGSCRGEPADAVLWRRRRGARRSGGGRRSPRRSNVRYAWPTTPRSAHGAPQRSRWAWISPDRASWSAPNRRTPTGWRRSVPGIRSYGTSLMEESSTGDTSVKMGGLPARGSDQAR